MTVDAIAIGMVAIEIEPVNHGWGQRRHDGSRLSRVLDRFSMRVRSSLSVGR